MTRKALSFLFILTIAAAVPMADIWDTATDNDDTTATDNELTHGTFQTHDVGVRPGPVADQDWYRINQKARSSWEVVMDSTGGDVGYNSTVLQLVDGAGTTITNAVGVGGTEGVGYSRSLRFRNTTASDVITQYVRVAGANCGTTCTSSDTYAVRARETTVSVARFNNAGSQVTVLLSQNTSSETINATYFYWSTSGALLTTGTLSLAPKALNVFNTTSFGALVGVGGSITVAHDGPFGGLNIKSVALEPSTGFSFDTPGVTRPF